ncbi:MAG: PP0621 family protein [Candidatus Berkiella sp.]
MLVRLLLILLILALISWVALWFVKRSLVKWLRGFQVQATQTQNANEVLVQCVSCQTFLPKNRAIVAKDNYYCCEEHASLSQ